MKTSIIAVIKMYACKKQKPIKTHQTSITTYVEPYVNCAQFSHLQSFSAVPHSR